MRTISSISRRRRGYVTGVEFTNHSLITFDLVRMNDAACREECRATRWLQASMGFVRFELLSLFDLFHIELVQLQGSSVHGQIKRFHPVLS